MYRILTVVISTNVAVLIGTSHTNILLKLFQPENISTDVPVVGPKKVEWYVKLYGVSNKQHKISNLQRNTEIQNFVRALTNAEYIKIMDTFRKWTLAQLWSHSVCGATLLVDTL